MAHQQGLGIDRTSVLPNPCWEQLIGTPHSNNWRAAYVHVKNVLYKHIPGQLLGLSAVVGYGLSRRI